ncbi:myrosinase 1-like [Vespa mandarinia]|uniref:myrosinase 1-like n=1 Tax=Vespa mandarinia TaxID=7446 RepID=UPI001617D734|nr:myrosinase 1-like [Vespa mandarinia]
MVEKMWPFQDTDYFLIFNIISKIMLFSINDDDTDLSESNMIKEHTFSPYQIDLVNALTVDMFPNEFNFGVSTSAYQTEGAWNIDGKGESIWDHMTHLPNQNFIYNRSNADVAADSYHHYKNDIKLAKDIGSKMYKISISWPRILPNGLHSPVNLNGIRHYESVINEIIANGMTPMVTLFHWDLPYTLQQIGGLSNPLIIDFLVQYAMIAFDSFGDKVKYWVTINEPSVLCQYGYGSDLMIPGLNLSGRADYICGHNLLLAHGEIYDIYQNKYQNKQNGKVGIVLNLKWFLPKDPKSIDDNLAAERAFQWWNGWFLNPLFSEKGDYPELMKKMISDNNVSRYLYSRLPNFEFYEIQQVQNSADFLGISFGRNTLVRGNQPNSNEISFQNDAQITEIPMQKEDSVKIDPSTLAKILNRIDNNYQLPPIIITEIGYMDDGNAKDIARSNYHHDHLSVVLKAMKDGIDIRGYLIRSFIDSFEWMMGYTVKSGIFSVDFADKNRTRRPRLSAIVINDIYKKKFIRTMNDIYGREIIDSQVVRHT